VDDDGGRGSDVRLDWNGAAVPWPAGLTNDAPARNDLALDGACFGCKQPFDDVHVVRAPYPTWLCRECRASLDADSDDTDPAA
jgi:hypothetical protein